MAENRPVVISEQTLQSLDKLIAITESLTDNLARANRSYERYALTCVCSLTKRKDIGQQTSGGRFGGSYGSVLSLR